jgi:small-conductance mechanosensitive channel
VLIVPYSGIDKVTNFGRDWGIMKLRFTVPFGTDTEKGRKIFKKIGQEMMDNPELAPGFIEPFKGQGVAEFTDYGIVVRGKFMHKPGAQFGIRKQIFKRVQEEFAANGIEFARREVKVSVSGADGHLTDTQLQQVSAAAAETVAQQDRDAAAAAAKTGAKA